MGGKGKRTVPDSFYTINTPQHVGGRPGLVESLAELCVGDDEVPDMAKKTTKFLQHAGVTAAIYRVGKGAKNSTTPEGIAAERLNTTTVERGVNTDQELKTLVYKTPDDTIIAVHLNNTEHLDKEALLPVINKELPEGSKLDSAEQLDRDVNELLDLSMGRYNPVSIALKASDPNHNLNVIHVFDQGLIDKPQPMHTNAGAKNKKWAVEYADISQLVTALQFDKSTTIVADVKQKTLEQDTQVTPEGADIIEINVPEQERGQGKS